MTSNEEVTETDDQTGEWLEGETAPKHKRVAKATLAAAYKYGGISGLTEAVDDVGAQAARQPLRALANASEDEDVYELYASLFPRHPGGGRLVGQVANTYIINKAKKISVSVARAGGVRGEFMHVQVLEAGTIEGTSRKSILLTFA